MKESRGITPLRTILQNCLNHIENLETNPSISDNYDKEFQDLKQFSEALKTQKEYSCTEGEKEVNRKKNRYKDILPFNLSRVILTEYAGIPGSDYINANFIKGASGSPAYIASQGPLPNTVNDFWRMVVECEVQVIVMACNAQESGKHKCENYWVEKEGEEKRFGMVQICLVKASIVCPDFLVRTMRLKYTNDKDITEERTVCQFHYSAWPDHGVPPLVRPLLDMVRLVRDTQASETLPVLVHCSAGCGRTGTICAIDFVWGLLRAGKLTEEFSLYNLVKDMRKQRVAMVQTKEQYILVHQAVRELFKEQLRVIESHPYENIDFNGVPLIKDFEEPFYDTICPIQKEEICDEKQDKCEVIGKGECVNSRINKIDAAPPLPRKKRPNVIFSKQEKEAENLTEKNRSSFVDKDRDKNDASLSSLLGKPRIVKLRALFEKSPTAKERTGLKEKVSQTVSRSHSLGAIRKPSSTPAAGESLDNPQGEKGRAFIAHPQPISDVAKFKNSKTFSRSVPLIKRSKSLKSFTQPAPLCVPSSNVVDHDSGSNYRPKMYGIEVNEDEGTPTKFTTTCDVSGISGLAREYTKRRRSLESLMGDVSPSRPTIMVITESSANPKAEHKPVEWSPKLKSSASGNTRDRLQQELQRLSLEKEKKINTFGSGIGVRERRNSFRQAVSKNEFKSVFQDRNSHGESVLSHNSDLHLKNTNKANELSISVDQPDGTTYLDREVAPEKKPIVTKSKSVFDVKKFSLPEQSQSIVGESGVPKKTVISRHLSQQNPLVTGQIVLEQRTQKTIIIPKNKKSEERNKGNESKNLFLKKLNSEIYEREWGGNISTYNESPSRLNCTDSDKGTGFSSRLALVRSDSKKNIFRTNTAKPVGSFCVSSEEMEMSTSGENLNNDRIYQPSSRQNSKSIQGHQTFLNSQKASTSFESYRSGTNSSPIHSLHPALYCKPVSPHKNNTHQNSLDVSSNLRRDEIPMNVRHPEPFFPSSPKRNICSKRHSNQESEISINSYRKSHTAISDSPVYATIGSEFQNNDKNLALPSKMTLLGKNGNNYDCISWSHSGATRTSGDMNSSEHSSDSPRLLSQYDSENSSNSKPEGKVTKVTEQIAGVNKPRLSDSSEKTSRKHNRSEELKSNSSVDFCNYGIIGSAKPRHCKSKYSKDDFLLEEPTAPPRVRRHASVMVPRNPLNGTAASWTSSDKTFPNPRNTPLHAESPWNGSIGVDLDAVAASMQQQEKIPKDGFRSDKNPLNTSGNMKKKQHYI